MPPKPRRKQAKPAKPPLAAGKNGNDGADEGGIDSRGSNNANYGDANNRYRKHARSPGDDADKPPETFDRAAPQQPKRNIRASGRNAAANIATKGKLQNFLITCGLMAMLTLS